MSATLQISAAPAREPGICRACGCFGSCAQCGCAAACGRFCLTQEGAASASDTAQSHEKRQARHRECRACQWKSPEKGH